MTDNRQLQRTFFNDLKTTYGSALETFLGEVPEEVRNQIRDQWESDLRERGLPDLELANLVSLSTLVPLLQVSEDLSKEELQAALATLVLVLIHDVVQPNSKP